MSVTAVPDPPPDRTSREPAMAVAGYTALVTATTAIVGLLLAFGIGVTEQQGNAIVGAVVALAALAPLVSGWFTRSRVYAPATVATMIDQTVAQTREEVHAELPPHTRWSEGEM